MGNRLHIDQKSGKVSVAGGMPLKRLALGFVLGCFLFVLVWLGKDLMAAPAPAVSEPAAKPIATEAKTEGTDSKGWGRARATKQSLPASALSPGQVGSMLLVIIVLTAAAAIILRRYLRRARLAPGKQKVLDLVDAMPLGPKRFVYVINLQGRTLVLGAGGDQVNLLAEYGEDEWPAAPVPTASAPAVPEHRPDSKQLSRAVEAYTTNRPSPSERQAETTATAEITIPAGAHRVPEGFRHLLKRAMEEKAEA